MKYFTPIFFLIPFLTFSQYSNYYTVDVNSTSNINYSGSLDVSGNVNVNKNVTTIDYGALANAYATRERNRIEGLKIANQRERQALIAIAENPENAFNYGTDNNYQVPAKMRRKLGWKKFKTMYHKMPHQSLFVQGGTEGYTYINQSPDGVKTEIIIYPATNAEIYPDESVLNIEENLKFKELKEGELQDLGSGGDSFLHKKDISKTTVARIDGFKGTLIWEDDYEKCITDNYASVGGSGKEKYLLTAKVRFKGDKDEVTFEQLEGRRYYFRTLIDKIISTINYY